MKPVPQFLSVLALTLAAGLVASPAFALTFEDSYPSQSEIEVRQINPSHHLNTRPMAMESLRIDEVIHFATNADQLTPAAKAQVRMVAATLKSTGGPKHVMVEGYTDNVGKDARNQRLSYHRALRVMHELVADGIPAGEVSAQGFGKENPIATNSTAEGRAMNRRVSFTVICADR